MADFTLSVTTERPYAETVQTVRDELAEVGFGVLTEIDLRATLHAKLGVEVTPQVILGACRPQLAHQALTLEPSIAALLPCNVVVRFVDESITVVEAFDPAALATLAGADHGQAAEALRTLVEDARARLTTALRAVAGRDEVA